MTTPTRGRPRASSRETIADAAIELFLEQGYEATSVTEITRRAGVSRSSFFNYFSGKSDILWFVFDKHLDAVLAALEQPDTEVAEALAGFGAGTPPETLALAIVDARTMGVEADLTAGRAERQLRLGAAVAARLAEGGGYRRCAPRSRARATPRRSSPPSGTGRSSAPVGTASTRSSRRLSRPRTPSSPDRRAAAAPAPPGERFWS